MTGQDLKAARKEKGLTQAAAAARLHVTQGYVSMLERGRRPLPSHLVAKVLNAYHVPPLGLPLHGLDARLSMTVDRLAKEMAALGYPGFSYMRVKPRWNPAELLVAGLLKDNLEPRVAEALPWLAMRYLDLDWNWVVSESKQHDVQNRLGFTVTLARELAETKGEQDTTRKLREVESQLERSVLFQPQTFCHENMTQAERRWLQQQSSPQARRWNVLSDLSPEHLAYAA